MKGVREVSARHKDTIPHPALSTPRLDISENYGIANITTL